MARIYFKDSDLDGTHCDYLIDSEDNTMIFYGFGGKLFPRGVYQSTNEKIIADQVEAIVWQYIDMIRI